MLREPGEETRARRELLAEDGVEGWRARVYARGLDVTLRVASAEPRVHMGAVGAGTGGRADDMMGRSKGKRRRDDILLFVAVN